MIDEQQLSELFPSFEQELVTNMVDKGGIRAFAAGESLMKTGQNIRSTLLITKGLVKIYREDEEGDEFFMYYLEPGQACALSMICATRQETSQIMARAMMDTECITIPLEYMDRWMTEYKSWYHFVLETYRSRFEELLVTVDHIAFRHMDERLLFYLQKQQEKLNTRRLPISVTEIAADLNSSREVISRLLKKLADKGHIRMDKSFLEIVSLDFKGVA
ncbi:MAG: Crp/Fnr family transcriptional regulator [Bacteroidetes bacterium]|nr:Crp/Fnr family transcriptional regulator [Bacteroidota bacterium]